MGLAVSLDVGELLEDSRKLPGHQLSSCENSTGEPLPASQKNVARSELARAYNPVG